MSDIAADEIEMRIVAPPFANSASDVGASRAVIVQIWIWAKDSGRSEHVMSRVELVPDEVPRIDVPRNWHKKLRKSEWTVYGESAEMAANAAREWYSQLVHSGQWKPSWRKSPLTAPEKLVGILQEPHWPTTIVTNDDFPFQAAARRSSMVRRHLTLVENPVIEGLLTPQELGCLQEIVLEKAGLDLKAMPEFFQSAHFLCPAPILRGLSTRLDSDEQGDKAVLIDLIPRKGEQLGGLEVLVREHRPIGQRLLARFRPEQPFCRVPLTEDVEQVSVDVVHDEYGLLVTEGPYSFLKQLSFTMDVSVRQRRVQTRPQKGIPSADVRVPVLKSEAFGIGGGAPRYRATQILRQVIDRRKLDSGPSDRQMWFRDNVAEARGVVRRILGAARTRAMVVDPYFGPGDVSDWLPHVAHSDAEVLVLTSRDGLRPRATDGISTKSRAPNGLLDNMRQLESELKRAVQAGEVNPASIRVMGGNPPHIHDRFLVADSRVWLLGSSLNRFGSRGTMLVSLPKPQDIIAELEGAWSNASELSAEIARLSESTE